MKVLLYEKEEDQIELLRNILNKDDFSLVVEREANSLFSHLKGDLPELFISNFGLTNGGIDLVNAILAQLRPPFPYVLFLTENQSEKYAVDCLGPVMGDILSKPVRESEINARILVAERAIALQKNLRHQHDFPPDVAMYDELTNLLNRQAVYERSLEEMHRSQREGTSLLMSMIEIVNAGEIEDQHGEETVRQAIRFVARAIRANVRIYDVVGRYMETRYLLLQPGVPEASAGDVIRRVYDAIHSVQIRMENDSLVELVVSAGYIWREAKSNTTLYDFIDQANTAVVEAAKERDAGVRMVDFHGLRI